MKSPTCRICRPGICSVCRFHQVAECHRGEDIPEQATPHEFREQETLCVKHQYLVNVENAVGGFDQLNLTPEEKVEVASELKRIIAYPIWFFGISKECLPCRFINDPDATECVKCGEIFVCQECWDEAGGKPFWRCKHAAGVTMPTVLIQPKLTLKRAIKERDDSEPKEKPEPRVKPARFTLEDE